jgi:transposase-like protein
MTYARPYWVFLWNRRHIMERRKFTREFKFDAVKLIAERGVKVTQVSRDFGVHGTVLHKICE